MKQKYYRTYITTFETSTGLKYYAGMHESKYEDPKDDPYFGSGTVIRRAVKKYGKECIKSVEWFEHQTKDDMLLEEVRLISYLKSLYDESCLNIHSGGYGGNTLLYASDEEKESWAFKIGYTQRNRTPEYKAELSSKLSKSAKMERSSRSTEKKAEVAAKRKQTMDSRTPEEIEQYSHNVSVGTKLGWKNMPPEKRKKFGINQSKLITNMWATMDADTREDRLSGIRNRARKSEVWHNPLYSILWKVWNELGRPTKRSGIQNYCRSNNITDLDLKAIIKHFKKVVDNECALLYDVTQLSNITSGDEE